MAVFGYLLIVTTVIVVVYVLLGIGKGTVALYRGFAGKEDEG